MCKYRKSSCTSLFLVPKKNSNHLLSINHVIPSNSTWNPKKEARTHGFKILTKLGMIMDYVYIYTHIIICIYIYLEAITLCTVHISTYLVHIVPSQITITPILYRTAYGFWVSTSANPFLQVFVGFLYSKEIP